MAASGRRGLWLVVSLLSNLSLLGLFKYGGFVVENLNAMLALSGTDARLPAPDLLLPVGISFYTFQSMSYTIDYYRGRIDAEPDFVRFATFVSLFPQLVAGPIERAAILLPQLRERPRVSLDRFADGLSMFVTGLFKKVALANWLALFVDSIYAVPERHSALTLAGATFFFAWQIYFDFSGYTDMARGIARMMGLELMLNFAHPYLAAGLGDFWRRWHISLSTWFRDYVYVPLGGNRLGAVRTQLNIAATMVISGLWHGAAWTFVIWGVLHAVGLLVNRALERAGIWRDHVPTAIKRALVFAFVCVTWIFFRAANLDEAWLVLARIASLAPGPNEVPIAPLAAIVGVWTWQLASESRYASALDHVLVRVPVTVAMLIWLALVPGGGEAPFIYFQF